ncbi:aurora kinase A- and ninein-interacting protein isoform X3 [Macrotis lagotis]|uniref:aurora kinase A- and ninein-interacting protein isoform X3 n=1 Tax=Macrotis lagotis TaxID=92651 RepID=UPI003D68B609
MRRRAPVTAEACGVWLDAAALKRRKVQVGAVGGSRAGRCSDVETRLSNPIIRMLPPPRDEKETSVGFTQRRTQPVGTRQTVIASFFTSKSEVKCPALPLQGDGVTTVTVKKTSSLTHLRFRIKPS